MHPRVFYDTHVVKNFEVWAAGAADLEKARQAAAAANTMADRMFTYLSAKRPNGLHGSPTPGAFRRLLTSVEPDFKIVWDTAEGRLGLHLREFAPIHVDGDLLLAVEPIVAVTLDSGEHATLRAAVGKTVKLWDRILAENGM
jgi:hypothetical protein